MMGDEGSSHSGWKALMSVARTKFSSEAKRESLKNWSEQNIKQEQ
jgi:hypothetical protein